MKKVTMKEIAERAGTSRTTVSFVLNNTPGKSIPDTTRDRVLEIAHSLGYFHDRIDSTICIVIRSPYGQVSQASYLIEVMRALSATVDPYGYQVTILEAPKAGDFDYASAIKRHNYAGLVLFNVLAQEELELSNLIDEGFPIVAIGQTTASNLSSVDVNNAQAAYQAVQHLIDLGHTHIAMIPYASEAHLVSAHRITGYRQALTDAGLPVNDNLIETADFTSQSGYDAMQRLLNQLHEVPTAVFAGSDVIALGVMQAIKDADLAIPHDVSVVGFDDIPLVQYLTPALTTINRPAYQIGKLTGEIMLEQLQGKGDASHRSILLDSKLILRNSTIARKPSLLNGHNHEKE